MGLSFRLVYRSYSGRCEARILALPVFTEYNLVTCVHIEHGEWCYRDGPTAWVLSSSR
jgi:hypothetical protein